MVLRGELAGTKLAWESVSLFAWKEFRQAYPDGRVLQRDTGYNRSYGSNPYVGYDRGSPFLFDGKPDERLPPMTRVVGLIRDGKAEAWTYDAFGRAVSGPLQGNALRPVAKLDAFWFTGLRSTPAPRCMPTDRTAIPSEEASA